MVSIQSLVHMVFGKVRPSVRYTITIIFGLVLLSLHLMLSATEDAPGVNGIYGWLLLINTSALVLMLILVSANVYSLLRQLKKREAGSKLTARMVFLFVLLALAPTSIVYVYSMLFLHRSIDSWYDVKIDQAMEDALELSKAALDQSMRARLKITGKMAQTLDNTPNSMATISLNELLEQSAALELTLLSRQGRIIGSNSINPDSLIPSMPATRILSQLHQGRPYVGLDPPSLGQAMQIRTLVIIRGIEERYLQALYPVPVRIAQLAESVETALIRHREMNFLRKSLKISFSLSLSLVLLLSLLAAIWVAFVSIRHIVAPVKDLALGTREVAAGNYARRLQVQSQDDLGFLVQSFNEMTERIATARDAAHSAQQAVEQQHAYLQTVLGSLSSGVLSFDADTRLRTANQAANMILDLDISHYADQPMHTLISGHANLSKLLEIIQNPLEQASGVWQMEVNLPIQRGKQTLLCRGAPLFDHHKNRSGAVVILDDITLLIEAQKKAAWSGVAQRLAHEIKNPLTPIQLSAERLQHKLGHKLTGEDANILSRATSTIVQQVEAMKTMVNTFSEYARLPKMQLQRIDLNKLVGEVVALYLHPSDLKFELSLYSGLPSIEADPVKMRQVLHNLIKNAQEAMQTAQAGTITLSTRWIQDRGENFVKMSIYDTGPGIPTEQADKIFDPYITHKPKGSGLGLAIVKKIIEEHGGTINLDYDYSQGAGFIIHLPALIDTTHINIDNRKQAV